MPSSFAANFRLPLYFCNAFFIKATSLLDSERDASVEYPYSTDLKLGISRLYRKPIDRMRNTWLYLKFMKDAAAQDSAMSKTEIHDLTMTYYG